MFHFADFAFLPCLCRVCYSSSMAELRAAMKDQTGEQNRKTDKRISTLPSLPLSIQHTRWDKSSPILHYYSSQIKKLKIILDSFCTLSLLSLFCSSIIVSTHQFHIVSPASFSYTLPSDSHSAGCLSSVSIQYSNTPTTTTIASSNLKEFGHVIVAIIGYRGCSTVPKYSRVVSLVSGTRRAWKRGAG